MVDTRQLSYCSMEMKLDSLFESRGTLKDLLAMNEEMLGQDMGRLLADPDTMEAAKNEMRLTVDAPEGGVSEERRAEARNMLNVLEGAE